MTDLLPCPFCGSAEHLRFEFAGSQGYICCDNCGTEGPCDERAADPICDHDAAYDAWNRRAALARPEPEGPTDKDILRELIDIADEAILSDYSSDVVDAGRRLLARWGTPNSAEIRRSLGDALQPVPVSERLPGPGDLHPADQWCWVCGQDCCAWHRVTHHFDAWSYWLPAHALPVPADD